MSSIKTICINEATKAAAEFGKTNYVFEAIHTSTMSRSHESIRRRSWSVGWQIPRIPVGEVWAVEPTGENWRVL